MIKAADIKELVEKIMMMLILSFTFIPLMKEEWESIVMDYHLPLKELLK